MPKSSVHAIAHQQPSSTPEPDTVRPNTRDQILDVALRLFSTKGYEATSTREIAEALGVTKAALYYHFANKEDIFMALHLRLHALTFEAVSSIDPGETSLEAWTKMLDRLVDMAVEHRDLFLLHERNHALLDQLHDSQRGAEHRGLDDYLRIAITNEKIPLEDRLRIACAYKAVFGVLDLLGGEFADAPSETTAAAIRQAVHAIMKAGSRGAATSNGAHTPVKATAGQRRRS